MNRLPKVFYIVLVFLGVAAAAVLYAALKIQADERQRLFDDCSFQGGQLVLTSPTHGICVGDDGRIIPITSRP